MIAFWDTSAVLPLIFQEPHTVSAMAARSSVSFGYAWSWMRVEAEAGLVRRGAGTKHWNALASILDPISWIDLGKDKFDELCAFNRKTRLRAGDAGHLFCFQQASIVVPELTLICFDEELLAATAELRLRVWEAN